RRQIPLAQLLIPFRHRVIDELVYFLHTFSILRLYLRKILTLSGRGGRIRGVYSEEEVADIIYNLRLARKPEAVTPSHQPILKSIQLLYVVVESFHHVLVWFFVERPGRSLCMLQLILDAVEKAQRVVSGRLHITKLHLQIELCLQV